MEDKEEKTIDKKQILRYVKADFKAAKQSKTNIDTLITDWINIWDKKSDESIAEGRSRFVVREVEKQGRTFVANAVAPFNQAKEVISLTPITASDVNQAEDMTTILNYQWRCDNGKVKIADAILTKVKEGTVVAKIGWETKIESYKNEKQDMLTGMVTIEAEDKITVNRPTFELVKNEDIIVDPTATSRENAQFIIHHIRTTIGELRSQDKAYNPDGIYENVDKIDIARAKEVSQGILDADRKADAVIKGGDDDYENNVDKSRAVVDIYEYWGNLDIDDCGVAERVVVTFAGDTIIRCEENPMPRQEYPFVFGWFYKDPFGFWGEALASVIGSHQTVVSGLTRASLENFAYSNNSMYITVKGALDPFNRKLLDKAKPNTLVEMNPIAGLAPANAVQQIQPLQLPPQAFSMMEMFRNDAEMQTGISKNMQGISLGAYSTATESQITAGYGEKRMVEIVTRFIETFVKPLFKMWIELNKVYLTPDEVIRITENQNFQGWNLDSEYDVDMAIAISGLEATKTQQIGLLLQSITPLVQNGSAPAELMKKLTVKQCELLGFQDLSKELEAYQPQPDPMQQQVQQLEVQKLMAEIELLKAQAEGQANRAQVATTKTITAYERQQNDFALKQAKLGLDSHQQNHDNAMDVVQAQLDNEKGSSVK